MDRKQDDDIDDASSPLRCAEEDDLGCIEHDLHPDDGPDKKVHAEDYPSSCDAPAPRAAAPAEETSPRSPGGDESGWKCRRCTFVHEGSMSEYLLCSACSEPRKETAFLGATFTEDVPTISFECGPDPSSKVDFPLAAFETIEAYMHPKGHTSSEPEWIVVEDSSHKFHAAEYDPTGMSGTCTMSWIRQGDSRPFTTRWRVCEGRSSRGAGPALLSKEQEEEAAAATS